MSSQIHSLTSLIQRASHYVISRRQHGTKFHEVVIAAGSGPVRVVSNLTYQEAEVLKAEERALLALGRIGLTEERREEARLRFRAQSGTLRDRLAALIDEFGFEIQHGRKKLVFGRREAERVQG